MAAFTSKANGNWSASGQTTWNEVGVPGSGDTVSISHNVTVDVDTTIGNSPNDTTTVVVAVTGNLTVAAGKTLTVKGNLSGTGAGNGLTLAAGATLRFDATATGNGALLYHLILESTNTVTNYFALYCNGTSGNRCTVTQTGGAGRCLLTGHLGNGGYAWARATFTDFVCDWESKATYYGLNGLANNDRTSPFIDLADCTVTLGAGGAVWLGTYALDEFPPVTKDSFVKLVRTTFPGTGGIQIRGNAAHVLTDTVFADTAPDIRFSRATVSGCKFFQGFSDVTGTSDAKAAAAVTDCVVRLVPSGGFISSYPRRADWTGCHVIADGNTLNVSNGTYSATATLNNPHWTTPSGAAGTYAVTSCVFESFGSDGTGDIDYGPNATGLNSSFTYNLILPDPATGSGGRYNAGTLTTNNGWSGESSVYDHNTYYAGTQGLAALAEAGNGFANMVASVRSNIVWSDAGWSTAGFNKILYQPTTPAGAVNDMATPANLNHNCRFNLNSAVSQTNAVAYYDTDFSSSAGVGANDVTGDPDFIDATRNFSGWQQTLEATWAGNASPTRTDRLARALWKLSLSSMPWDTNYNAAYTLAAYLTYVRGGFAPQNVALQNAGHDGVTIGAVAFAAGATPGQPTNLYAGAGGDSSIVLLWDRADDTDTSMILERSPDNGSGSPSGAWATLATLPAHSNVYVDNGCWHATRYHYRVKAHNAVGNSAASNIATDITAASPTDYAAPSGVTVSPLTPTTAQLDWVNNTTGAFGDPHTIVEYSTDGLTYRIYTLMEASDVTLTLQSLTPGVTYSYRLRHVSAGGGVGPFSTVFVGIPSSTQPARTAGYPIEPSGLTVRTAGTTSLDLTWTNNDPDPNVVFQIERSDSGPFIPDTGFALVHTTGAAATSWTDTGLATGSIHGYRIRAHNATGNSDYAPYTNKDTICCTAFTSGGNLYEVGPGKTYASIAALKTAVPIWGPGDQVKIYYKSTPYREGFPIYDRGTPANPIRITGIPDPTTGALPVLSGDGAIFTADNTNGFATGGLISVTRKPGRAYACDPAHVVIESLKLQDAFAGYFFTYPTLSVLQWDDGAAAVYFLRVFDLTIQDCEITNCGNGLFGKGLNSLIDQCRQITIRRNYIHGNSSTNLAVAFSHGSYIEGDGVVYEFNHYGPGRIGSPGCGIKDRSAGAMVRYNLIQDTGTPLQMSDAASYLAEALSQDAYHRGLVYGNIIVMSAGNNAPPIWFGSDQYIAPYDRRGILYFYYNTVIKRGTSSDTQNLLNVSSSQNAVDARGNLFYSLEDVAGSGSRPSLAFLRTSGNGSGAHYGFVGKNWIVAGYGVTGDSGPAHLQGQTNLITGLTPQLEDPYAYDLRPAAGSPLLDVAVVLPGTLDAYPVAYEFGATGYGLQFGQGVTRTVVGAAFDLGAVERGIAWTPPLAPAAGVTAGTLSVTAHTDTTVSLSLATDSGGTPPYSNQLQKAPDASGSPGTWTNYGSAQAGTTASWTVTALTPSSTYWFRVIVTDSAAATANSNQVSQTTAVASGPAADCGPTIDTTGDWGLWDGKEPVTLTQVATTGDTTQAGICALRRPMTDRELQASYGVYTATDLRWLLPIELVTGRVKPRDRLTDGDGTVWTILDVMPKAALSCFWRTTCRALEIVNDLKDVVTIEVPTVGQGATGAQSRTWSAKYANLAARVQPQEQADFDDRGKSDMQTNYRVYVGQQLDPRSAGGEWGRIQFGSLTLEVTGYQDPERITDLPYIEAVNVA